MDEGVLRKLIGVFLDAGKALELNCPCFQIEGIAILVYRTMAFSARRFHTIDHVFGFLSGTDAIGSLAAVFHDLVYREVDGGLPPELVELLEPFIEGDPAGELRIRADAEGAKTSSFAICRAIFGEGMAPGKPIAKGGNEFLSALAMAIILAEHVPTHIIAAIAACIEASIPFRGPDEGGRSEGEVLHARLKDAVGSGLMGASEEELDGMVHRAIAFANADVRDFKASDPALFLTGSWKLLPESNTSLRKEGIYTVMEYRVALEKMRDFFSFLQADKVYHDYRGVPTQEELAAFRRATERNLDIGIRYLEAKLLPVAVLEAIAQESGGDAPMTLFLGDLPKEGVKMRSLMDYLDPVPCPDWVDAEDKVYRLLKDGRLDDISFDLKNSPLAVYLWYRLEPECRAGAIASMADFFAARMSPVAFLSQFDPGLVAELYRACASMVPTRKERLMDCASLVIEGGDCS